jgi:hypothetical protein
MLHNDLSQSQQYLREAKFKPAVASAFQRFENRLNELRDQSQNPAVSSKSGANLPYALFDSGDLKFPFPALGINDQKRRDAYLQSLKILMAGALGFVRNAYDHEQHNLPDLDEKSALELLFFASYLMRLLDESTK